jgi:CubicO group peptidase (beta-lactamase class C family)
MLLGLAACSGDSGRLDVPPAADGLATSGELSWWSRAAMDALCRFSVWRGASSGYIAMFAHDGVPIHSLACGYKDIESGQPMTLDTHVRIASMTKPVTAVAAMTLVEEGRLGLDDEVADYLPAFAAPRLATSSRRDAKGEFPFRPAQNPILVRHLLMFASGIGPGREPGSELVEYWNEEGIYRQADGDLGARVAGIADLPLLEEPGTTWRYGFSADVLARVMEVATGQTLADLLQQRVFGPLGMADTRFLPPAGQRQAMASVYNMNAEGELEIAPLPFDNEGWTPGGGGLVSTVSDYMRFALMLWNGGEYQGVRILRRETVADMTRLHVPGGVLAREGIDGIGWGLGMAVVADAEASLVPDNDGDIWWSGYYGTTFFVSPGTGLTGVVMTQLEPNDYAPRPVEVFLLQGLAHAGLRKQ